MFASSPSYSTIEWNFFVSYIHLRLIISFKFSSHLLFPCNSSQFFNNYFYITNISLPRSSQILKKRKQIICHVRPTIFHCWKISITCDYVIFLTAFKEFSIYPDRSQKSKVFPKKYPIFVYFWIVHRQILEALVIYHLFIFSISIALSIISR